MNNEKNEDRCGGVAGGAGGTGGTGIVHVSDSYHGVLDPASGCIGHVSEVSGGTSIRIDSSMTVNEALILLRHWRLELASIYAMWEEGCVGSSDIRIRPYAEDRVFELESMVASVIRRLCGSNPRTRRDLLDLRDISKALDQCPNEGTKVPFPMFDSLLEAREKMMTLL